MYNSVSCRWKNNSWPDRQLNIEYSSGASFRREFDNKNLLAVFHHPYAIMLAGPDNARTQKTLTPPIHILKEK